MSFRQICVAFALTFAASCATNPPTLYENWGSQLGVRAQTVDDVSLMIGSPPTRCDQAEPSPSLGFGIPWKDYTPAVIQRVTPNGAAAVAGLRAGDRVTRIAGKKVDTAREAHAALDRVRAEIAWDRGIEIQTKSGVHMLTPKRPAEAKQCYWEIEAGSVAHGGASAFANIYGAAGKQSNEAYQRFFRAACRFHEGYVDTCSSNWQQ